MPLPTPPPDAARAAVTLWRYAIKWPDGRRVYSTPALYYADSHPIPPDDPTEPGLVEVFKALPAAEFAALEQRLARAESALREARDFLRSFANDIEDEQAWGMEKRAAEARKIQARITDLLATPGEGEGAAT